MFKEYYDKIPDMDRYLDRINYTGGLDPILETLNALILCHQMNVPFENLDIFQKHKEISLGVLPLYKKIVTKRRGGYCFELNSLFSSLLESLGFQVNACLARVVRNKDYLPQPLHRGTLVALDHELYFCDVGFGGPMPGGAVKIKSGYEQELLGEVFGVLQTDAFNWTLYKKSTEHTSNIISFTLLPQSPVDFIAPNFFCSTHPSSYFLTKPMVNLRTPSGNYSIDNDQFIIRENDHMSEQTISSEQEFKHLCSRYFGLDPDEDIALET